MSRLEGRHVALTGAAGGIGSRVAQRMTALGARVTGIDRVDCPACAETIRADLSSQAGLADLVAALAGRRVDILINGAGLQYFGPFERQQPEEIWLGYVVNLVAPATLARAVVPAMRARGEGQIVNIGSVMGAVNYPYFATYSSAKAGLRGLSEGLRRELCGQGITITHIAPRAVATAFNNAAVNRFLELVRMHADDPDNVADRIVEAIVARRREVVIGRAERFYALVNAVAPRVIDAGLAGQTTKARALFAS